LAGFHPTPVDMGHDVWSIDLYEQKIPYRTSAYLIRDEKLTLVETGSALARDTLISSLAALGIQPADLDYVIVTHIHLDHAGGAGHFMELAPNATLVVHPLGARHMADPAKLWAGTGQVYGDRLTKLFGSIRPVPADRILVRNHGETLDIGRRTLTFLDSPGHAKHHFTILDSLANVLYAGDAVGIRYRTGFTGWDFEWVMPSTPPIDFDPVAIHSTMDMLEQIPFEFVYHAHFGRSEKWEAIRETRRCGDELAALIQRVYHPGIAVDEVIVALREWIVADLKKQGHKPGANIEVLDFDVVLDALGLMYYEGKRREVEANA